MAHTIGERGYAVLEVISRKGGQTFTELANELGGARGTYGFVCKLLEDKGYILRHGAGWRDAIVTPVGEAMLALGAPGALFRELPLARVARLGYIRGSSKGDTT